MSSTLTASITSNLTNYDAVASAFVSGATNQASVLATFVQNSPQWQQFLQANFGGTLPTTLTDAQQTQVNTFLQSLNSNNTYLSQFVNYIGSVYQSDVGQVGYALSPNAITQRAVLFSTFAMVVNMLQTLQNTVAVQAKLLEFYGQWQEAYTNEIAKVPVYTSQATQQDPFTAAFGASLANVNGSPVFEPLSQQWNASTTASSNNLSNMSVGYDNLSLQDLVNSLSTQTANANAGVGNASTFPIQYSLSSPPTELTFYNGDFPNGANSTVHLEVTLNLNFTLNSDGSGSVSYNYTILNGAGSGYSTNKFAIIPAQNVNNSTTSGSYNVFTPSNASTAPYVTQTFSAPSSSSVASNGFSTSVGNNLGSALQSLLATFSGNSNYELFQNPTATYPIPQGTGLQYASSGTTTADGFTWTLGAMTTPTIPWQSDTTSSTDTTQTSLVAQNNARLQQYIQNLQAYKQVAANSAQSTQSALDATNQSLTQQTDLLNTIVQTMQTIIASIFK